MRVRFIGLACLSSMDAKNKLWPLKKFSYLFGPPKEDAEELVPDPHLESVVGSTLWLTGLTYNINLADLGSSNFSKGLF